MRWMHALSRLMSRRNVPPAGDWDAAGLRADPPVCIIGDLHGRMDLLTQMLAQIAEQPQADTARRIIVGDMIDRGPDSIAVLRHLHAQHRTSPDTTVCLMGNHERMMLDFLADPDRHGPRWIAAGGSETLASAGAAPWGRVPMTQLAAQLRTALGPDLLGWVQDLPLCWQAPGIGATHAGADPALDLAQQPATRLLWGARGTVEHARTDGMWIAQGHDIVPRARLTKGRIMVDTGAWRSGLLSAVWIDKTGPCMMQAQMPGNALDLGKKHGAAQRK